MERCLGGPSTPDPESLQDREIERQQELQRQQRAKEQEEREAVARRAIKAGIDHYNAGRWAAAMQEFERALKHRPEDSSAQRYLRTVQKKLNEERDVAAMREGLKHLSRDLAPSDAGVNLNFPRPPVPHGGPLIFDDSDLNKPLDARQFITQQMYVSAGKHVERLEQQRQALETKLADLKRWRGNLAKEAGAVERLRRDATEGALVEIFQKVPISQALKSLEARKYINSETVRTLEASWNALNGLLSGAQGISAAERERQVKKVLAGHLSFRKALLAIPQSAPETKKWLEGVSKVYEAGAKVVDYSLKDNAHLWDLAKLVVEIGGVLFPPVALGVFVEGVGEQGAQYWADSSHLQPALGALGEALSRNWNAERHLIQKLDDTRHEFGELCRTIRGYEALHGPPASNSPSGCQRS